MKDSDIPAMMPFPVPLHPLTDSEKVRLAAMARLHSPGDVSWFHTMGCLWLHFCHEAGITPADAKSLAKSRAAIANVWTPAAAKIGGNCSNAIRNFVRQVASYAYGLHNQATTMRTAAQPGSPSLFGTE